jgi:tripartite-type tricarboxylate transporter receptor subunit TctC
MSSSRSRRAGARRLAVAAAAFLSVLVAACAADDGAEGEGEETVASGEGSVPRDGYFADRTVALVVNFSAGGGCDTGGRLLARYLPDNVAGQPQLFVQNVPGAGGLVGLNTLYGTDAEDGTMLGWVCGLMAPQALGVETVQYDAASFHWLGAAFESQVLYADSDLGIESFADLVGASDVVSGGFAPDSTKDLGLRTLLNLLEIDYQHVSGYPGNSDLRLALERNEINLHEETVTGHFTAMQPLVDDGTLVVLGQRGIVDADGEVIRDPRIPDIPTYLEAVVDEMGEAVVETTEYQALEALVKVDSFLRAVVYPPSTDPDAVEAMRAAVELTVSGDAYNNEAEQALGAEPLFVGGEEAQEAVANVFAQLEAVPEARAYLADLANQD